MLRLSLIEMYVCLCVCMYQSDGKGRGLRGSEEQKRRGERWSETKFVWMCMEMCVYLQVCVCVFEKESECVMSLGS